MLAAAAAAAIQVQQLVGSAEARATCIAQDGLARGALAPLWGVCAQHTHAGQDTGSSLWAELCSTRLHNAYWGGQQCSCKHIKRSESTLREVYREETWGREEQLTKFR